VAANNPTSTLVLIGFIALIGWRMYARVRRMIGRQRLSPARAWVSVCVFSAITLLIVPAVRTNSEALLMLAGGLAIGAALAMWGLRLTKFEQTPEGQFYTPNAHIGIALSVLFAGRVIYRLAQMNFSLEPGAAPQAALASSPLTLLLLGTLVGYYVAYAAGLLLWRRRVATQGSGTTVSPDP
jgi:hypothetical protein